MSNVEVYEVGHAQFLSWILSNSPTMRMADWEDCTDLGSYLVVSSCVLNGRCCMPVVNNSKRTLNQAVEYVDYYKAFLRDTCKGEDWRRFEVWHLVDDGELWGDWEKRLDGAKDDMEAMEALRQLRVAGELTDYHVYVDGDCVLDSELTIPTMLWHIQVIQRSVRLDKDMTVSYRRLDLWYDKRDAFVGRVKFLRWLGAYTHRPAYFDLRTAWPDSAVLDDSGTDVGASPNVVDVAFLVNVR